MSLYVDTNVIIRMYLDPDESGDAMKLVYDRKFRKMWPIPVTRLLQFEVVNGLERSAFESRTGGQWRFSPESVAASQLIFDEDLKEKITFIPNPISMEDVAPLYLDLALRHTAKYGFRTYDILHVAFALTLGCSTFFSYDKKAIQLAQLEGLKTN